MPSPTPSIAATPCGSDVASDRARADALADALRLFQLVTGAVDVPPDPPPDAPRRSVWQRLVAAVKSRAAAADTRSQTADDTAALSAPSLPTR